MGVANGHLIFQASEGSDGNGLWATDGTSEPVRLRAGTGVYGEFCQSPLVIADVFYCTLIQYPQYAVVRSDGTVGGTMLITPTTRSLYSLLGEFQGSLYYLATEIGGNAKLFRSDGTLLGEAVVADFGAGSVSLPRDVLAVGGQFFFSVFTPVVGFELWKSDGTALGTTMVRDIRSGPGSSSPRAFAALGSELYFVASDGSSGTELWKSDGTPGNTARVKDIWPGSGSSVDASGGTRVVAGSTLYFAADDGTSGKELWKTDGSELNTVRVADVYPGPTGSSPGGMLELGGSLYFLAESELGGVELWKSDGTPAGTAPVIDLMPGVGSGIGRTSKPGLLGGTIYLAGDNGSGSGLELWRTDGTAAGTEPLSGRLPAGLVMGYGCLDRVRRSVAFRSSPSGAIDSSSWERTLRLGKSSG